STKQLRHATITRRPYASLQSAVTFHRGGPMTFCKWLVAFLFVAAVLAPAAFAQTDQGRISGTVRDQTNAFVAEAKVSVKNERTGEERSATTNNQGFFLVTSLKPSTYTVKVEKAGFAAIEYTAMPVAVGQELVIDFEFKPAGVQ